jgi:hypothetical protein
MLRFFSTIAKLVIASVLTGAILSFFDLSAETVLAEMGLTPESVMLALDRGLEWAIPNLVLGALIIVPVWIVLFLFRPPRGPEG